MPTKTVAGNPIQLSDAAAGNAVRVLMAVEPTQEGSGTPSPTNVRPLKVYNSLTITANNGGSQSNTVTAQLGEDVYAGTLDVKNGTFTATYKYYQISAATHGTYFRENLNEDYWWVGWNPTNINTDKDWANATIALPPDSQVSSIGPASGSNAPHTIRNFVGFWWARGTGSVAFATMLPKSLYPTIANESEYISIIDELKPQVAYRLAEPKVIPISNLTNLQLYRGINNVSGNAGEITLEYNTTLFDITLPDNSWSSNATQAYEGTEVTVEYKGIGIVNSVQCIKVLDTQSVTMTEVGTNKWTFTMPASDVGIIANVTGMFPISLNVGEGGTAALSKTTAAQGDTIRVTVRPDAQKQVYRVFSNQVTIEKESDTTYTFKMPGQAVAVTVMFQGSQYAEIRIRPATGGTITADPDIAFNGDKVTLTVKTDDDAEFIGMTVLKNGSVQVPLNQDSDSQYSFTVTIP